MVTKNWYNVLRAYRAQQTLNDAIKYPGGRTESASYYADSYALLTLTLRPNGGLTFYTNATPNSAYYMFGRGTTPETVDDYELEDMITAGLSCTVAASLDANNDTIYKLTLTNTSSEDITIGEVGILGPFYKSNSSGNRALALMERTVLDAPLTIPAGGMGVIDYAIKLPVSA